MRRTLLRLRAPLISSIALAFGLLGGAAEPANAQGFGTSGGMGGGMMSPGIGRRKEGRGGGGFGGNFGGGPKAFRGGGGQQERFSGPKEMFKPGGRGMPMGDAIDRGRGPSGLGDPGARGRLPGGIGSRIGRDGAAGRGGRLGRIEGGGGPGRSGRFPQGEIQGDGAPKGPGSRLPWPKRDTATTNGGGAPKNPWPGRNPKDDSASTDGATQPGGRGPKLPGRYPPGNRDPKPTDQASTNPNGGGACVGRRCPGGQGAPTNGGSPSSGDDSVPCRGPRCGGGKPPQTGGDDVATGGDGPPCRGPRCGGGKPPQTGGDDVATGGDGPPCRGPRCGGDGRPPQTGDNGGRPDGGGNCRGRRGCDGDGRPPRRPPVIVIGPTGPLIPPPDDYGYDDEEPGDEPPSYTPPYTATPVYEPASPERPRPPVRDASPAAPTPPAPPPFAALPPSAAPFPMRRDFATAEQPRFRPNEVLVTVQSPEPDAIAGQLAQSFNLVIEESQSFTLLEDRRVYRFRIPDNRAVEDVVASVAATPGVTQSLPNFYYALQGESGSGLGALQYALPKLRVPDTQSLVSGRGVTVAVIDSGVDLDHPALKAASIQSYDAVNGGVRGPDKHGTAITGIIAGRGEVGGIAPGVTVVAVRAFAPERPGGAPITTSMDLARATDVAVARGARVVNMSFAGPRDDLLLSLIDAAFAKEVVFIAAAGNQGPAAAPAYPAAYEKVIGITATDEDDGLYEMANRGAYISVAAPGVDILVPVVGKGLDYMSGTSFAAAHISGIAALLLERNPKLRADQVRQLLLDAARDLGEAGRDDDFGAGLADAYSAVNMAVRDETLRSSSINR